LIKAAARFERHEEFTAWLIRNNYEYVEACDPLRGRSEQADAIYNLQREAEEQRTRLTGLEELVNLICEERLKKGRSQQRPITAGTERYKNGLTRDRDCKGLTAPLRKGGAFFFKQATKGNKGHDYHR